MIKRLIIVLIVAAGIVFVPWWLGSFKSEILPPPKHLPKWIIGFAYLLWCAMVLSVIFLATLFIKKIIHYIKHGK